MNENEKVFEVVFFSGDKTKPEFDTYFKDMPWPSMPWQDPKISKASSEIKVKGVPQLVVMTKDGQLLCKNAVNLIKENGPVIIEEWMQNESP